MKRYGPIAIAAVILAGAWYFHSTSTPPVPQIMNEVETLEKAKLLSLGITRAELIEELGQPIQSYHSKDGRYELLRFPTPPTSPGLTSAAVERETGRVVSIKAGADNPRDAEGFDFAAAQWDY